MTLNGVPIPAGSLLLTNGQISPDTIYAMNPATGAILASLPLAKQTSPATEINPTAGLYDQATNLIYVLGYSDNKIDAINPATGAIVNSLASYVPQNGGGLALDPTTHQLWEVAYGSTIAYLLDKSTGVILHEMDFSTVGVTNQITGMVFDSAGKIWLSEYSYGVLYYVDPATVGPQIPTTPVLTGITTVARDGTPTSSSSASANVAQVVNLVGTGFTINTQVGFPTRDNNGNVGLTYVNPTAVNAGGTQLQAVVPDNATTGNVTVYAPRASQNLGFSSYNDSVYRNITVPFTAQGTLDSIKFSDGSLQGIGDESWGIDNVKVLDASNNVVYSTNFENGAGPEWSNRTTDNSYPATFTQFLGRFSNDSTFLSLANLTAGGKYTLHFDFYAIDSWDGNTSSGSGPDYFDVGVDGTRLFHNTFLNYNAFASGVSQTYTDATTGQGSVYLQVVPTLTGVTGAPGSDGGFTLYGSGFMKGASTVSVGGYTVTDSLNNTSIAPTVTGSRNSQYGGFVIPDAVEAAITITTAGGSATIAGLTYTPPAFVEFDGIANSVSPASGFSVVPGQTVTLVGRGFTNATQVQFPAADDSGFAGIVTRTGTASSDGTTLTVTVPAQAKTGDLQVVGSSSKFNLNVAPSIRSVGGTVAAGNTIVLEGVGFVTSELAISIDGQTVDPTSIKVRTVTTLGEAQQVAYLTVPSGVSAGVITVTTSGGTAIFRPGTLVLPTIADNVESSDAGDTIALAQAITLPENTQTAVSGTIGNNAYGNKDVDMYAFTANAGDFITIGGQNSSPYPYMRLFDASGNQLATRVVQQQPEHLPVRDHHERNLLPGDQRVQQHDVQPECGQQRRQRLLQRGVPDHAQPVVGGRHHRDGRRRRHAGDGAADHRAAQHR